MLFRCAFLFCAASVPILAWQCDCVDIGAAQSKSGAEIVFQGVVDSFHDLPNGHPVVVFHVSRVWKGRVTAKFETPGLVGDCAGWHPGLLKIGNELLVFAAHWPPDRDYPPNSYWPQPCATKLVRDATDLKDLGSGEKPK